MKDNSMNPQILIVGDVMLDRYTWGRAERVSPEAPVLVLEAEREESRLGGAGAVAALVAALGVQPVLAGIVGDDSAGRAVSRLVAELKGGNGQSTICDLPFAMAASSDRPTTVKERLIGTAAGRHGQALLRVDRESRQPLPREVEDQLLARALETLRYVSAVLISDYGKGVCTPRLLSAVIRAARQVRVPVLVDPRRGSDYALYRWATLVKPNRREASEATGREIRCVAEAFAAGQDLCARWGLGAAVITLDADGMVLVTADGEEKHVRACQREICDVTGAGDTVLAMLGAALAGGMPLVEACSLANVAAALQVERLGVAPISWHDVHERAKRLTAQSKPDKRRGRWQIAADANPARGVTTLEALIPLLAVHRNHGRRIVFTNGCFDLLHAGHVHCLQSAKKLGDVLVVAMNSDASIRRLKGPSRPIVGAEARAAVLEALGCVDHVVVFDDDSPERIIESLRPDVLVKGAEYRPNGLAGESIVLGYGGQVELVPLLPHASTTAIVERLRSQDASRKRAKPVGT